MVIKLNKTKKINQYNSICISTSKKCGYELRMVHYKLGCCIGRKIVKKINCNQKIAIYIYMRAGLLFGMGIADEIEKACNNVKVLFSNIDKINFNFYDKIIIVDAVVNTGKTIKKLIKNISKEKYIIATNVISKEGCKNLKENIIYASRISKHSYIGSKEKNIKKGKGPDTGDRLYNSMFFN